MPTDPRVIDPGGRPLPPPEPPNARLRENTPDTTTPARVSVPALPTSELEPEVPIAAPTVAEQREPLVASNFRLDRYIAPSGGAKERLRNNTAAIEILTRLDTQARPATADEQQQLARWTGWGALPQVFDPRTDLYADEREQLRTLLSPGEYRNAQESILNAHYTDPELSRQVWKMLVAAGFSGGRVLEPGCGSGNFIGHSPDDAVMVGVELDPITSRIAAALYPSAQIRNEGFETTRVPENSFVATVGNVPFGDFSIHDPIYNPDRHSIHNYFILKSLALTAPGGYVAVVTSRFTLDAVDPKARLAMAVRADLIAAVRLPSSMFRRIAGTEVVTDLLVFRTRDETAQFDPHPRWVDVATVDLPVVVRGDNNALERVEMNVNQYFVDHPAHVHGQMRVGHGMYSAHTLRVDLDHAEAEHWDVGFVGEQLTDIVTDARRSGLGLTATPTDTTRTDRPAFVAGLRTPDANIEIPLDTLRYDPDQDSIQRWSGHAWIPNNTVRSKVAETRRLIELRDIANDLITAQRNGRPAADRDQLRVALNARYDDYVRVHGPINRFTLVVPAEPTHAKHDERVAKLEQAWRTKEGGPGLPYTGTVPQRLADQWDEQAWDTPDPYKRRAHLDGGIRNDPGWSIISALESFDERTQTARKAALFSTDVLTSRAPRSVADSPHEALALTMEELGRVEIERVAQLRGITAEKAHVELAGLVFVSPTHPDTYIPATSYLSGNVRAKLATAELAAKNNPVYWENVRALREVVPTDVEAHEVKVRPGVPWVPTSDVVAFIRETFQAERVAVDHIGGRWTIDVPSWQRNYSALMTEEYGTDKVDAIELLENLCNSRPVIVERSARDIEQNGGDPIDMQATFAAQAKATKISERFAGWLFEDNARAERLVAEYNQRLNSLRAPRHDGTHLRLPGLSDVFTPHPYQRDAVARIIAEPTVLLDHVVGAGKSGTMFMAAMELKRLGLVNQPWIVVPNHILEQVGREAKQWYPAANVLMGTAATTADGRRRLVAQSAASDWDMVIVAQSAFTRIGVSPELKAQYIEENLDELRAQMEQATIERTKKTIERAIKAQKAKLDDLTEQSGKDTGVRFEESGCDYLLIDEAHMFKNKGRISNVAELSCAKGSMQAEDLAMKLDILRQRRRDEIAARNKNNEDAGDFHTVERVATFATGTPIANSLGEMWVMQKYLRPDLLDAAGVASIDDWGATYTGTTTSIEVNATGTKLRPVTRVGKFVNLPELLQLSSVFTDVVLRDQVPVNLPQLVDGQRQINTTVPDLETRDFITDLAWRADNLDAKNPARDNNLKISSDGRNVSLDPRLAHLQAPSDGGRAAAVAEQIIRIHDYSKDTRYRNEFGQPSPTPGALQIVFCDRGTPKPGSDEFTMYAAIAAELIARGMEPDKIRFVHDARKPSEKIALQQDCRNGDVSVLLGSTEKMGTGTNVQTRAIALHHVDVPWRPADLEQREGRIIRQGNQNHEIEILNYVTEATFDTIMWQKVQAKALFVNQAKRNEIDVREIEDLDGGDIGTSAAATKAMATGDPRYLRQVQLDDDVKRLTALQRAHADAVTRNSRRQSACERRIPQLEAEIADLDPIVNLINNTDKFTHGYTVAGRTYTERKHAAPAFADALRQAFIDGKQRGLSKPVTVGAINGVDILAARSVFDNTLHLSLAVSSRVRELSQRDLFTTDDHAADTAAKARGLLTRAENLYAELPDHRSALIHEKASNETELDQLRAIGHQPFEHGAELDAKRTELDKLTVQLRLAANSDAAKAEAAAAAERMDVAGRTPGWSLLLNPTPAVLQEVGIAEPDELRRILRAQQTQHVGDTMRGTPSTRPDSSPAPESVERGRHLRRSVVPPRRTGHPSL